MSQPTVLNPNVSAAVRHNVYLVLITCTLGMATGRVLSTERVVEPSLTKGPGAWPGAVFNWPAERPHPGPTFSSNDRARWLTMQAIVEHGTYAIGRRTEFADGTVKDEGLLFPGGQRFSIDHVLCPDPIWSNPQATGSEPAAIKEFFSSKPPLLPTLLAGLYWLMKHGLGWSMATHSWEVTRTILLLVNVLPFGIYLWLWSRWVERQGTTDFGRIAAMAAACFATFLLTFQTTLNNHTIAACAIWFALVPIITWPAEAGPPPVWRFAVAGLFAAWAVVNELPAASFGALYGGVLLLRWPRRTLGAFVPPALAVVGAFFLTNYLAVGTWEPVYEKFGTVWYRYAGAYWSNPMSLDMGGDPPGEYALHLLVGHHGIFSLSPIFMLIFFALFPGVLTKPTDRARQLVFTLGCYLLLAVVFGFYMSRTQSYNYGGWTSGPRWFFWFTPLFLMVILPVLDGWGRWAWGRGIVLTLLFFSVLSVFYPAWNPWRHPWIYNAMLHWRWVEPKTTPPPPAPEKTDPAAQNLIPKDGPAR
jgi:hypothetical protein